MQQLIKEARIKICWWVICRNDSFFQSPTKFMLRYSKVFCFWASSVSRRWVDIRCIYMISFLKWYCGTTVLFFFTFVYPSVMVQKRGKVVMSHCCGGKIFEWQQTENFTYKVNLHCFKLHWSCSIWFNFSNAGKIFWGWIWKDRI